MIAEFEVQRAIRARLVSEPAVIARVPAANIVDTGDTRLRPAIILGESQSVDEGTSLKRAHTRIYHTLHLWARESSTESVKATGAAVARAIRTGRLILPEGLHCADMRVSGQRFLRDPDGEHSHGVLTLNILVTEARP